MKKLMMLLCTLCLTLPMFAQEFTDDRLTDDFVKQVSVVAAAGAVAPGAPVLSQLMMVSAGVASERSSELTGPYAKPVADNPLQAIKDMLAEKTPTLNEETPFKFVMYLAVMSDMVLSGQEKDDYIQTFTDAVVSAGRSKGEMVTLYMFIKTMDIENATKNYVKEHFGDESTLGPADEHDHLVAMEEATEVLKMVILARMLPAQNSRPNMSI